MLDKLLAALMTVYVAILWLGAAAATWFMPLLPAWAARCVIAVLLSAVALFGLFVLRVVYGVALGWLREVRL